MTGIIQGWIDEVGPQVATLISSKPELKDDMLQDPAGFVLRELGIKLPFTAKVSELDGIFYVRPTGVTAENTSEELSDELLDLVSGGGNFDCGNNGQARVSASDKS
jgi:hypothetical protein